MRTGCNRALYETPNVKDYDVIWIDDFLDQLIVPREDAPDADPNAVSVFTLSKVIYDFIKESGLPRVSSRDIGRYLKQIKLANWSLLDEMKQSYGGLYQFLTVSGIFDVVRQRPRDERLARIADPTDKTFWYVLLCCRCCCYFVACWYGDKRRSLGTLFAADCHVRVGPPCTMTLNVSCWKKPSGLTLRHLKRTFSITILFPS